MRELYVRDYYMRAAVESEGASQAVIARLQPKDQLKFVREPDNPNDRFAIKIETMSGEPVGYVNHIYSQRISVSMFYGIKYKVFVEKVTKGRLGSKQYGVDLRLLYTAPDLSNLKKKKYKA